MDTREVIARFEAERQALALMDHPNIAKIIDAGTTGGGDRNQELGIRESQPSSSLNPISYFLTPDASRPYFVMELVRGLPITEYCDQAKLPLRERLKLFIAVCQAVQHAHQKGIIHRDLKPSNVMVTLHDGVPVPKIIDFGVAKALNQRLSEHTIYTRVAQLLGTPMYMSPEQAELSGLDVDTRSDVYSLGVLLYELLTGQTPFDKEAFSKLGYDQVLRIIREDEPPRPSARISTLGNASRSTVASRRGVDERQFSRSLRGELDWIVMKALEKDRTRRYGSSDALAADVQRFLDDEPVQACPPSAVYRLRKLVRRKQVSLTTLVVLLTAVVAIALTIAALRERSLPPSGAATGNGSTASTLQSPEALARAEGRILPGLVPNPAIIPDVGRWQLITKKPRGVIRSAVWSPDERQLALAEANHVRIYDAADLKLLHVLVAHSQPVRSVAWHPDGKRLASCSEDGTVRLWTLNGIPTYVLSGHKGPVYQVTWRPDGSQLASCGADGTVRLWSPAGQALRTLDEGGRHIFGVDWSPDGSRLATVGGDIRPAGADGNPGDNSLRIWDPESGTLINSIPANVAHSGLCLDWHPDSRSVAVGYGRVYRQWTTPGPSDFLLGAGVRIWQSDGTAGREVGRDSGSISSIAWSPDGERLAFGGRSKTVYGWNMLDDNTSAIDANNKYEFFSLVWSRDSSRLLIGDRDSVQEWRDGFEAETLVTNIGRARGYFDAVWNTDGTVLACSTPTSAGPVWFCTPEGVPAPIPPRPSSGAAPWWESFHPSQDAEGYTIVPQLEEFPESNGQIRFVRSPDGWIAAASWEDHAVRIWDNAGNLVAKCEGHRGGVESVAWSPDASQLVSGGGDSIRIWNRDGSAGPVMTGHEDEVYGLAWSPDGQWIASGGTDSTVRLWKPDGSAGPVLRGHSGGVMAVAFSPDSRKLASASWLDNSLRVWDVATGRTEWQALRFDERSTATISAGGQPLVGDPRMLDQEMLVLVERRDGTCQIESFADFRTQHRAPIARLLESEFTDALATHSFERAELIVDLASTSRADDQQERIAQRTMLSRLARALCCDGHDTKAEATLRKALDSQAQIVAATPSDLAQLAELAQLQERQGQVLTTTGRFSAARAAFTSSAETLRTCKALQSPDSDQKGWDIAISIVLWKRAVLQPTHAAAMADLDALYEFNPKFDCIIGISYYLVLTLDELLQAEEQDGPSFATEIDVPAQVAIAKSLYLEIIRRYPSLPPRQDVVANWLSGAPPQYRDPELAMQLTQRALARGLDDNDTQAATAWAQLRLGQPAECLESFKTAKSEQEHIDPRDLIVAIAEHQLGNLDAARAALARGNQKVATSLNARYADECKGTVMLWDPTIPTLRRLQAEATALLQNDVPGTNVPKPPAAAAPVTIQKSATLPEFYLESATEFALDKRYDDAIRVLGDGLRQFPDNAELRGRRGWTQHLNGNETEALADTERALELDPHNDLHFYNRVLILHALGRDDDALAPARLGMQAAGTPDVSRASLKRLAVTYQLLEQWEPSLDCYQELGESTRVEQSELLRYRLGRPQAAIDVFSNLLSVENTDEKAVHWVYLSERGYCLAELGRFEEARADYASAIRVISRRHRPNLFAAADSVRLSESAFAPAEVFVAPYYRSALLSLHDGDHESARAVVAQLNHRALATTGFAAKDCFAWTCALFPDATDEYELASSIAQRLLEAEQHGRAMPKQFQRVGARGRLLLAGILQYRRDRWAKAQELLRQAESSDEGWTLATWPVVLTLFQSMTEHKLGNADAARTYQEAADRAIEALLRPDQNPVWERRVTLRLLQAEAAATLAAPPALTENQSPTIEN